MKNYCLLIILFVQLFKGNCQPVIEVDNGKLNLSHLDFKNNPIYKIKGNVLFFKNKSYKNCIKNKPEFIQIPAIWNDILDNSTGFGTYIFYLEKGNDEFLTLEFDNINCAYNLYINKNLVNSAGIYSENEIYYKPGYKKNKVKLHFDSSNVEVALEVSNYSIQNGGICENIFIGTNNQIELKQERKLIVYFFMFGSIFIISFYYFFVFLFSKEKSKNYNSLTFAIFGFLINIRSFIKEGLLFDYFQDFNWFIAIKLEYITLSLTLPLFYSFFYTTFKRDFYKSIQTASIYISIVFTILVLFTSTLVFSKFLVLFHLILIIYGLLVTYSLINAIKNKRTGSLIILSGFIIFFVALINDILNVNMLIHTTPVITFGVFCFIIAQALLLARLYVESFANIQSLTFKLTKTNNSISRFVPDDFLKLLNKKSITEVALNDNIEMEISIMFSDIRAFTEISEKLSPNDAFNFINDYLKLMGPIIRNNNGFIDKYIGDGIMALFPQLPDDAIKTGLKMFETLKKFNQQNELTGRPIIDIGIGIHTGTCLLGTIGETERLETTVISDSVNLAARIESLTKHFKCRFIISEFTLKNCKNDINFKYRLIGIAKVKGKSITTKLYEVITNSNMNEHYILDFNDALESYFDKHFEACLKKLNSLQNKYQINDLLVQFYLNKCNELKNNELDNNWQAIEVFEY